MNEETGLERLDDLLNIAQVVSDLKHLFLEVVNTIKLYFGNEWKLPYFCTIYKNKGISIVSIFRV